MPFYSRHSSDGRDWFLGGIQDEEEYDQFMNMIFISSNFTNEIQNHYDGSDAGVLPPSSTEEEKIDKTRKYQKNITVSTTKKRCKNHTLVSFAEKLFPTALISEDTKNLKDVQKQKPMFSEISSYS